MCSSSPPTYKGRSLGIAVLVIAQFLIGVVHVLSGLILLSNPSVYAAYTLVFGLLVLLFGYGLWIKKFWGWYGTVVVSTFVIVVDLLALFNLPSSPNIPKLAAGSEILYSLLILIYLIQTGVRNKFIRTNLN